MSKFFWGLLFLSIAAVAAPSAPRTDVVIDIDKTLGQIVEDPSDLKTLADRGGQFITIDYSEPVESATGVIQLDSLGKPLLVARHETYFIYQGVPEKLAQLKLRPDARISVFSARSLARNRTFLQAIRLPDGSTALDGLYKVRGAENLTRVGFTGNRTQMFRKDICTQITADCEHAILFDDNDFRFNTRPTWIPVGQYASDTNRFQRASDVLLKTLDRISSEHVMPSVALKEVQATGVVLPHMSCGQAFGALGR